MKAHKVVLHAHSRKKTLFDSNALLNTLETPVGLADGSKSAITVRRFSLKSTALHARFEKPIF